MPYLQQINRQRKLVRGRPRPTANGNFVTFKSGGIVYALVFTPNKQAYIFYKIYNPPQSMPIGYRNNPLARVLPKPLGTATRPQDLIPLDLNIPNSPSDIPPVVITPPTPISTPVPVPQEVIPTAKEANQIAGYDNGNSFQLTVNTSPVRLYQSSVASKLVVIVTDSGNAGNIYVGFSPSVSTATGVKLPKGSSISIPISDAGSIYIVGENTTDKLSGFYLV